MMSCKSFRSSPLKNALVLCISFFLIFTGYNCSVSLLSSLNIEHGMGVTSQSVLYAVAVLGNFTLPPLCMKKFGVKMTIVISAILYTPYVAVNFYPAWGTFIPAAILIGVAGGPLWASAMSYVTAIAKQQTDSIKLERTVSFYFGLLFTFLGLSSIFGNLVSFYVLQPDGGYSDSNVSEQAVDVCGINFCDSMAIESGAIVQPSKKKVWLLTGFYATCVLLGALLPLFFLDDLNLSEVGVNSESDTFQMLLLASLRRFKIAKHWYLLPITIFAGIADSFLAGDFTKAYVACSWGIYHIGLAILSCGVMICVSSFVLGLILKVVDRIFVFVLAALLHTGAIITLWYWTPDTPKYVLYIVPAVWGFCTAVWQSQVRALYGVLFPEAKSTAFAFQGAVEALGFLIGFAISSLICTEPKLWLLVVLLFVGIIGYAACEVSHRRSNSELTSLVNRKL